MEKKVNLLTDHQALQPVLKRNRAHKQYSARLTRWLDRHDNTGSPEGGKVYGSGGGGVEGDKRT